MNHHDAEISDVVVVLNCQGKEAMDEVVDKLKAAGLEVVDVNVAEYVVEGSIGTECVADLKKVPGVSYIRNIFNYTADFPEGDPRDKDGPEETPADDD